MCVNLFLISSLPHSQTAWSHPVLKCFEHSSLERSSKLGARYWDFALRVHQINACSKSLPGGARTPPPGICPPQCWNHGYTSDVTDWRRREGEKLTLTSLTSSWRHARGWGSAVPGWRQPLIRRIRVRFAEFITWWFGGVCWNTLCRPTLSTWPGFFVRGFIATNRDTETLFEC